MSNNTPSVPPRSGRPSLSNELDEAFGGLDAGEIPTVFVVGLSGRVAGKLFKIRPGESLIGRSSRAFVCFDERAVSHQHARLVLTATGCTLEDLESTNGTFLNDVRLTAPQLLQAGDVIRIGNNALGFLTDAADEQQHTRAMARLTAPRMTAPAPPHSIPGPTSGSDNARQIVHVQPIVPPLADSQHVSLERALVPAQDEGNALDNALDKLELIVGFLKRYWPALAAGTLIGNLAGAGVGIARPPVAHAEFEIYLRQEATPDPTRPQNPNIGMQGGEFFAFAERKFLNTELVLKTLEEVGMPANKGLAGAIAARLDFSSIDRQGTFRGSFIDTDRAFAERFLAAHLQTFLEAEINKALQVQASEVSLMHQEFDKNEAELNKVEKQLQEFKEKHLTALPEYARGQLEARGNLLAQRDRIVADISRYQSELELKKQQLSSGDAMISTKVARSLPYETSLAEVRRKIAQAEALGYTSAHPELIRLKEEEARVEQLRLNAVNAETSDADQKTNLDQQRLKDRMSELSVVLGASQQELKQVEGRLGEIAAISGQMPEVEADITRLLRQAAAAKEVHERLHLELKGKELELKFERASVAARYELMKPPHATQPPRLMAILKLSGLGAAAGLALGIFASVVHWVVRYAKKRKIRVSTPSTALARPQP